MQSFVPLTLGLSEVTFILLGLLAELDFWANGDARCGLRERLRRKPGFGGPRGRDDDSLADAVNSLAETCFQKHLLVKCSHLDGQCILWPVRCISCCVFQWYNVL